MCFLTVFKSQISECDFVECLCLKSSHWPAGAMVTVKDSSGKAGVNPLVSPFRWLLAGFSPFPSLPTGLSHNMSQYGEQIQESVKESIQNGSQSFYSIILETSHPFHYILLAKKCSVIPLPTTHRFSIHMCTLSHSDLLHLGISPFCFQGDHKLQLTTRTLMCAQSVSALQNARVVFPLPHEIFLFKLV